MKLAIKHALAAGSVALATACGLAHTVDRAYLADITIEQKLLLFDAQNEVAITVDERDQILRDAADLRDEMRQLRKQMRDAEEDIERAQSKRDGEAVTVGRAALVSYETEYAYLETRLDYDVEHAAAQDRLIRVAQARYELAKANLVKRSNVRGASDVEVPEFEAQVAELVAEARAAQAALAALEKQVEAAKTAWEQKRSELSTRSGDALGNPWVDGAQAWGEW